MKKNPIIAMLAFCFFAGATPFLSAQNASSLFNNSKVPVTWMGVDFTQVKVLGETGTVSAVEMIDLFGKINDLIINESEKYNIREALRRTEVPYDLDAVTKANAGIDPDELISNKSGDKGRVSEETIAKAVKKYTSKAEGAGLVFFMETLDKPIEKAVMWVTFFDLGSGNVLLTEKLEGKAQGFGFRNHWARPVYNVLKDIEKKRYDAWKSKYRK